MQRKFMMSTMGTVVWVINCIVTLGCLIAFFCIDGHELMIGFYIPLDVALNFSKACFFFMEY